MAVKKLNYRRMSDEQLRELFELERRANMRQQEDILAKLLETTIMIMGKKGRGKTLSGVALSYMLRERFDRPVVVVGSSMGMTEAFGPHMRLDERAFRDELERMAVAASEEENAEQVANAFEKYGVSLLWAIILFDEARKLASSRRSSEKLVQLVGDYVMQSRHYHNTIIFLAPAEDEIDKRIVRQVEWKGRCFHNKYTNTCHTRLRQGLETLDLSINGKDASQGHAPFYDMYDSWTMLGYRQSSLMVNNM